MNKHEDSNGGGGAYAPGSTDSMPTMFDVRAFAGSADPLFADRLAEQLLNGVPAPANADEAALDRRAGGILAQMRELGPRNGLEGLLAAQMVAMHGTACEFLRRAMLPEQPSHTVAALARLSTRMLTLFAQQTELLQKLRGCERQTLRIEHVRKVEDGGVSMSAEAERVARA